MYTIFRSVLGQSFRVVFCNCYEDLIDHTRLIHLFIRDGAGYDLFVKLVKNFFRFFILNRRIPCDLCHHSNRCNI